MAHSLANLSLKRCLAVIDVETTGLSPRRDRIIEVAALIFGPAGNSLRYTRRVHPGMPIPPAAAAVHGITDGDVKACPPFEAIAQRLAKLLKGCDLCGFNIKRFDLPFLCAEFTRAEVRFSLANRAVIDVQEIYHARERRNLESAVRFYLDREHRSAHRAMADVYATANVLDAQLARYSDLPNTVAELGARFCDVDVAGKLRREADKIVLGFGKYAGLAVEEVASHDPEYLRWLLRQDFLDDFVTIISRALDASEIFE